MATTQKKKTNSDLDRAKRDFESYVKKGRKKLFELETLDSLREIKEGKGKRYESAADVMRDIRNDRDA